MVGDQMLTARRASMASITSMAGRAGLAACGPTGCFSILAEPLAPRGQSEGQSSLAYPGRPLQLGHGVLRVDGSGATSGYGHQQQAVAASIRSTAQFRHWITPDGRAAPLARGASAAKAGRYHLLHLHACPWAHRTAIFRRHQRARPDLLSQLGGALADGRQGWDNSQPATGVDCRSKFRHAKVLHAITPAPIPDYSGRGHGALLWDKETRQICEQRILGNHRMFNRPSMNQSALDPGDYYPRIFWDEIDQINQASSTER